MKRIFSIFLLLSCLLGTASAQDRIVTKDGDFIDAYHVDIGETAVYYKLDDTADAPLKSIEKSAVLMVRRKDGTKVNLYDDKADAPMPQAEGEAAPKAATEVTTEESRQHCQSLINAYNTLDPSFIGDGKDGKKKAGRVLCLLGIGKDSQVANDDVEILTTTGHLSGGTLANIERYFTNPAIRISVKNRTRKTLYVDLGNTFVMRNGVATAYYVPSSTSSGVSSSSGVGVNMGAVAGALGVGGAVGTLARGVNVGGGSGKSSVTTTYSQRVVAIPPMSMKNLEPQVMFAEGKNYCQGFVVENGNPRFNLKEDKEEMRTGQVLSYDEAASPIRFSSFVSYSFTEDCAEEKSATVTYYLRELIGFNSSPWYDNSYSCNAIKKSFGNYTNTLYFVGGLEEMDGSFPLP